MTEEVRHEPSGEPALTWREARHRLRSFLTAYASETPPTVVEQRETVVANAPGTDWTDWTCPWIFAYWLDWDLDVYIGAFGSSLAIVTMTCLARIRNGLPTFSERDQVPLSEEYLQLQNAAGILVFLGSLINLWMIRRRRYSNSQGNDSLKRREISRFLKEIEKQEEERLTRPELDDFDFQEHPLELDGTALAGVYSVFRRKSHYGGETEIGSWCRIPTLLLVNGDHVALQIGDIAPADCRLIEHHHTPVRLEAGELITLETFKERSTFTDVKLPRGRTTLPKDSDKLLALCNNMRIFEVLDRPLEAFLRQSRGKLYSALPGMPNRPRLGFVVLC